MTGPSAVTVSLMDGAWKEVKRLPLGPSLSDAWWRFGGLIEVKVSSNRTKFPAVFTKKIKGIAMWYKGTSKAFPSQPQYKRGKQCTLNTKENCYLCPWTLTVPEQTGQSYSSVCAQASSGVPHSPYPSQNENITFAIAFVLFAACLLPWQGGDWTWQTDTHTGAEKIMKQPVQMSSLLLPFGS